MEARGGNISRHSRLLMLHGISFGHFNIKIALLVLISPADVNMLPGRLFYSRIRNLVIISVFMNRSHLAHCIILYFNIFGFAQQMCLIYAFCFSYYFCWYSYVCFEISRLYVSRIMYVCRMRSALQSKCVDRF